MSQASVLLSPSLPAQERSKVFPILAIVSLLLVSVWATYESWILHTDFYQQTRARILNDPRVIADFGSSPHIPIVIGWSFDGKAKLTMLIQGQRSSGIATARLVGNGGNWSFLGLEVDHWINASPGPALATRAQLHGQGRIYLVAVGNSAQEDVAALATFMKDDLGVSAQILPVLIPPPEAYDGVRKQWIAEMLTDAMAEKFPDIADDEDASILGVTSGEIYIRSRDWITGYNYRLADKYSVIQTARLNPSFYGRIPSPGIARERLRKVAMKALGEFYFHFPQSSDPESVMAFETSELALDRMRGFYLQSDLQGQRNSPDSQGSPCLSFTRANVAGLPRLRVVHDCMSTYDGRDFFEVDLTRGEFRVQRIDLYRSAPLSMYLSRLYGGGSYPSKLHAFGKQTWHNFDDTVWSTDPQSIQTINVGLKEFHRITPGAGFSPTAKYVTSYFFGSEGDALLTYDKGHWRIQDEDGDEWHYLTCTPTTAIDCLFIAQLNVNGDRVQVERDAHGHIMQVAEKTNPQLADLAAHDDTWTFSYNGDLIQLITNRRGGAAQYQYDPDGFLTDVEADGHVVHYGYDVAHRMNLVVEDGVALRVEYNAEGRPVQLRFPNGSGYRLTYNSNTVEIAAPDGQTYTVQIQPGYFSVKPKN
jgi:YD repeat-containing protein